MIAGHKSERPMRIPLRVIGNSKLQAPSIEVQPCKQGSQRFWCFGFLVRKFCFLIQFARSHLVTRAIAYPSAAICMYNRTFGCWSTMRASMLWPLSVAKTLKKRISFSVSNAVCSRSSTIYPLLNGRIRRRQGSSILHPISARPF